MCCTLGISELCNWSKNIDLSYMCKRRTQEMLGQIQILWIDSAKKLIDAAKHNKDEVLIRIADRLTADRYSSVKSVVFADLFCHNLFHQNYMRKYDRDIRPEAQE